MTNSSRITISSNICAAPRARPAICNGQIQPGGNPFEGPRSRPYPNPPQEQSFATLCSARPRANSATSRFRSRPATCRRPTRTRSACGSAPAPIAASANGSAAAIIPRQARRPRSCRCWSASRISAARDNSEVTRINTRSVRQTRDRRHFRRYERRGMGAAGRPRHPRRLSRFSTSSCCCIRRSGSPTTRSRTRA